MDTSFQAAAENIPLPVSGGTERLASPSRGSSDGGDGTRKGAGGFTRKVEPKQTLRGKVFGASYDKRKYRYDVLRGSSTSAQICLTREDRMSPGEAGDMLHSIHSMFGIAGEGEDLLGAFDRALWVCHTVNGASTLLQGRSQFGVPGHTQMFDYAVIRDKLGVHFRRFFRAYADDIAAANKQAIEAYDPDDPVAHEIWAWIVEVAQLRGMSRYPHLAHDSADACTGLNAAERAALAHSKSVVIGSTTNSADRMFANDRNVSADRFDSTTLTTI